MPVTRRQLLQQLDEENAGQDVDELPSRQVLRTPMREQFTKDELEWAENAPERCDPIVNADHQST